VAGNLSFSTCQSAETAFIRVADTAGTNAHITFGVSISLPYVFVQWTLNFWLVFLASISCWVYILPVLVAPVFVFAGEVVYEAAFTAFRSFSHQNPSYLPSPLNLFPFPYCAC